MWLFEILDKSKKNINIFENVQAMSHQKFPIKVFAHVDNRQQGFHYADSKEKKKNALLKPQTCEQFVFFVDTNPH